MIRMSLIAVLGLTLAGCTDGPAPTAAKAATRLTPGMTEEQVFDIMGAEAGHVRNPDNWDQACISYGSEGAYTHVVFEGGVVLRASGGHAGLCDWGVSGGA
ncbi:hypothetical protein [Pacificoceanicola onchidii]|uniref:hypothetical protein n=1 Tax=Pacificoceanicola onchidii TaxID=2562685 RepID=UPI0010A534C3|nr:hypothetical protein [Pacificoceanicola onchidii]